MVSLSNHKKILLQEPHLTTIRDICKVSGLGPGTLYNYIKKKEDILYLIYNELTMMLTQCLIETIQNNKKNPLE